MQLSNIFNRFIYLLLILVILFVPSCSSTYISSEKSNSVCQLSSANLLTQWKIKGQASLQQAKAVNNFAFAIVHDYNEQEINLDFPFGLGHFEFKLDKKGVEFNSKRGKIIYSSLEEFLKQEVGIVFPLDNLSYWLQMKAAPGFRYRTGCENDNLILYQASWKITYIGRQIMEGRHWPKILLIEWNDNCANTDYINFSYSGHNKAFCNESTTSLKSSNVKRFNNKLKIRIFS